MTRTVLLVLTRLFAVSVLASASFAKAQRSGNPNHSPEFTSFTPERITVDLRIGQTSFEATGTAIDRDIPAQIVSFTMGGAPSFCQFESFDGNPGSFRFHAENLTGAQYGVYGGIIVVAMDNHPFPMGRSIGYSLFIVPEPSTAGLLILSTAAFRSRRG